MHSHSHTTPTKTKQNRSKQNKTKQTQPGDISRIFTVIGIVCAFFSTFFAHGFLSLARQAINQGKAVKRSFLVQNLVRNTNINLLGIGITLVGLQASGERLEEEDDGDEEEEDDKRKGGRCKDERRWRSGTAAACQGTPPRRHTTTNTTTNTANTSTQTNNTNDKSTTVGTLVSKTMLAAANAPYAAPTPGGTLVSLDVFSLQASTNVLLAHFVSIVFSNLMLGTLNRMGSGAATA